MCIAQVAQAAVLAFAVMPGPASSSLPEPIVTRQTLFAIPFRVERADHPSREPTEVQLYVSFDQGRQWQLYHRVPPAERQFHFRAGADGEFWFAIRTLNRQGQLRPEGEMQPGLRVVVDATPPEIHLEAGRGEAGQAVTRWEIHEPNPRPESLAIQYRAEGGAWQQVAVGPQNFDRLEGPVVTGQIAWWPPGTSGPLQIRAEVADAAGNIGVSHAQLDPALPPSRPISAANSGQVPGYPR